MFTSTVSYQYDPLRQRLFPRVELPEGEVFAGPPDPAGENLAAVSDRALYFYPGREASNTLDPLQPLLRVPVPGPVGKLGAVDLVELLDGYLVSFSFTDGAWSGETIPYQQVVYVDGDGGIETIARRQLKLDLPLAYTMRAWWLSPAMRQLSLSAQQLFAAPNPLGDVEPEPPPRDIRLLAAALCVLSLLAGAWLSGRQRHSPLQRWVWVLACGVVGLPALASLWLMYPMRERADDVPLAQVAAA